MVQSWKVIVRSNIPNHMSLETNKQNKLHFPGISSLIRLKERDIGSF